MRDKKGRFQKIEKDGIYIKLSKFTFRRVICWILAFIIFLPWISIVSRFDIIGIINGIIEGLLNGAKKNDAEPTKKNGIFY